MPSGSAGRRCPDGTPDDVACERSTDSLAAEIGHLLPARVLNLACPSATVTSGLRGPQDARRPLGARRRSALLKQVQDLRFVVVAIGPNDVGWTDFLRYCYGVAGLLGPASPRASSTTGWPRSTASTATC